MKMVRFWNWAVDLRIFLPSLLVVFLCGGREVPPPAALPFEPLPINVHHTIFGLVYTSRHSRLSGVTGPAFLSSWAAVIDGACCSIALYHLRTSTPIPSSTREETVSESQACAGASGNSANDCSRPGFLGYYELLKRTCPSAHRLCARDVKTRFGPSLQSLFMARYGSNCIPSKASTGCAADSLCAYRHAKGKERAR